MTKLFFGGFPFGFDELDLVRLVAPYGDVSTVKIVRDRKTKKCIGYAFLEMSSPDDAARAVVALDGAELDGRMLKLSINTEPEPAKAPVHTRVTQSTSPVKPRRPRLSR